MCTVVIRVPIDAAEPVRVLAVRDEDPERAWDAPGEWWPGERPGVIGIRDRRAGGAWLAATDAAPQLAVILNRADLTSAHPQGSRGTLVLDAVSGVEVPSHPDTHGFNLVTVEPGRASVTSWDGDSLRSVQLAPGTHMIAHDDVDDPETARIAKWLTAFDELGGLDAWEREWLSLLGRSAELGPHDDAAIIRDNRVWGLPTQSLLVCTASVGADGVQLAYGELAAPGLWDDDVTQTIAPSPA